jgi:hypothetical protein
VPSSQGEMATNPHSGDYRQIPSKTIAQVIETKRY